MAQRVTATAIAKPATTLATTLATTWNEWNSNPPSSRALLIVRQRTPLARTRRSSLSSASKMPKGPIMPDSLGALAQQCRRLGVVVGCGDYDRRLCSVRATMSLCSRGCGDGCDRRWRRAPGPKVPRHALVADATSRERSPPLDRWASSPRDGRYRRTASSYSSARSTDPSPRATDPSHAQPTRPAPGSGQPLRSYASAESAAGRECSNDRSRRM